MSDPRKKTEQNQEVMALYKARGREPGGRLSAADYSTAVLLCVLYRVLNIAIELRHAPWLWVVDLSSPESLALSHLLPLILVGTQFLSQKMTPAAGVDPVAAENDDVHAADVRLYVLLGVGWASTILVNRKFGGYCATVDDQQVYAFFSRSYRPATAAVSSSGDQGSPVRKTSEEVKPRKQA